jgi:hypothetical protein
MAVLFAASAFLAGLGSFQPAPIANEGPEEPIVVTGNSRIICRNMTRTGTRFTRRACVTFSARDARRDNDQRVWREIIDAPLINGSR